MTIYRAIWNFYQRNDVKIQAWVDQKVYVVAMGAVLCEIIMGLLWEYHLSQKKSCAYASDARKRYVCIARVLVEAFFITLLVLTLTNVMQARRRPSHICNSCHKQ